MSEAEWGPGSKRLFETGKKRILALDGGVCRGMISISFLKKIETVLRQETGRQEYVLSDFFDLIGGTSVGSLLATQLAMGEEVDAIADRFVNWAPAIFSGRRSRLLGMEVYDARRLTPRIKSVVGEETLSSHKLKTGLVIVSKRVDTGSPWLLSNNPKLPYWDAGDNKNLKLWSLLRASTAAPIFFTPIRIEFASGAGKRREKGLFVDGGVSPHNNPALQLFLMATLPAYQLNWATDPKDLLIISVGCGSHRTKVAPPRDTWLNAATEWLSEQAGSFLADAKKGTFAAHALRGIISDGMTHTLTMMQAMSRPRFSWRINTEIGTLHEETFLPGKADPLFSFQRYDIPLEPGMLPPELDIDVTDAERLELQQLTNTGLLDTFRQRGDEAAGKQVDISDFKAFL